MRRTILFFATNRYTDGSGRQLDGALLPTDLYTTPISNRAYPVQAEHWELATIDPADIKQQLKYEKKENALHNIARPSPHKGNVIISGGGVLGLVTASLFSLRGWHTSVLERGPSLRGLGATPALEKKNNNNKNEKEPLKRPFLHAQENEAIRQLLKLNPNVDLKVDLITRRAVDVLESAGVPTAVLRQFSTVVEGVLDHPGAYNSLLFTYNLSEYHKLATKMLCVDYFRLRYYLEGHLERTAMHAKDENEENNNNENENSLEKLGKNHNFPNYNCKLFYDNVIEAVYPLKQQLLMKPFRGSAAETAFLEQQQLLSSDKKDKREVTEDVLNAFSEKRKKSKKNTSLALNTLKWEKLKQNPSYEMGDYDLLVSCEGKNSHLRHLLDVEGFSGDIDFAQQWFLLRLDKNQNNKFYLNPRYIHRWLHKRQTQSYYAPSQYHVRSAYQVPLVLAYPRVENENLFSVCIYAPLGELKTMTDAEKFRYYMKDVFEADPQAEFTSFSEHNHNIEPAPTIFCENLFNTVGLPSAVLLGNAAHHCNPFWLQSLAIGLEDAVELVNQVDAFSKNIYEALYQFSNERGPAGDALRLITDRSLYYQRKKHVNPFIRFQNYYQHLMQVWMPRGFNNYYDTSTNQLYSKSIEEMFNGRGYTSYEYAEKQQNKHCMFYHLGRLYT